MQYDEDITTRTRIANMQKKMDEYAQQRQKENEAMLARVQEIAAAIDRNHAQMKTTAGWWVRLWVFFKKVLSFAHSEAKDIRLEE